MFGQLADEPEPLALPDGAVDGAVLLDPELELLLEPELVPELGVDGVVVVLDPEPDVDGVVVVLEDELPDDPEVSLVAAWAAIAPPPISAPVSPRVRAPVLSQPLSSSFIVYLASVWGWGVCCRGHDPRSALRAPCDVAWPFR